MPLSRSRDRRKGTRLGHAVRPLAKRLTPAQVEARAARMVLRGTFRQETVKAVNTLAVEHAQTRGLLVSLVRRGLWGRLKWLVIGR